MVEGTSLKKRDPLCVDTGSKNGTNCCAQRMFGIFRRDFYFRALGFLVVLSFPQLLSFSSVFPKPLSETLTRSSDGRNPVQLTVPCWWVGPRRVGPHRVGLVERDRVGQDETVFGHMSGAGAIVCGAVACGAVWARDVATSGFCLFRPD
jgi:hypothetical protein